MFKAYDSELLEVSKTFNSCKFINSDNMTYFLDWFNNTINKIDENCSRYIKNKKQELCYDDLMNHYILNIRTKLIEVAHIENRTVSWHITGRSGLNVDKYNKKQDKANKKNLEFINYIEYIVEKIERKMKALDEKIVERKKEIAKEKKEKFKYQEHKFNSFSLVINPEIARIQFLFDEKPSEEIRTKLKKYAFKWSPTNSAWQRVLTNNALYVTRVLIKELKEAQ